jgi:hypothetical protein
MAERNISVANSHSASRFSDKEFRMKPSQEQIQQRAYELFVEHGCECGRELEDWLAAEKELTELAAEPELRPAEPKIEERRVPKTKTAVGLAAGVFPA